MYMFLYIVTYHVVLFKRKLWTDSIHLVWSIFNDSIHAYLYVYDPIDDVSNEKHFIESRAYLFFSSINIDMFLHK